MDAQPAAAQRGASSDTAAEADTGPPTSFPRFPDLPTELRLKIWKLSFLPRVVEVHRRKSHYADDHLAAMNGTTGAKWQSWSHNPPALAVSYEARACALTHFSASIRLAVNTPCERSGEARLDLHRRLYLAPHADTLAVLGEFNVSQTVELLRHISSQTGGRGVGVVGARGLRRLALSASSIGHPGSGILLLIYSRTIFQDLDQLVLFLYNGRQPPATWHDGHMALVDCHDSYAFRMFLAGQATELRSSDGDGRGWMTVGYNPLEVLDLVFGHEAEAAATAVTTTTSKASTRHADDAEADAADDDDALVRRVDTRMEALSLDGGGMASSNAWVSMRR